MAADPCKRVPGHSGATGETDGIKVEYDVHDGPPTGTDVNPRGGRKMVQTRAGVYSTRRDGDSDDDLDLSD